MKRDETIKLICIKVSQPLGDFYISKIDGTELFHLSEAEVREMKEKDFERRLGIQRELSTSRVNEIKEYVETADACFPNSVILSTRSENIVNVERKVDDIYEIELLKSNKTFQIIDGQHRIAGLENYRGMTRFDLNISLFLDMDIEQQAILFSTINMKQKTVSKQLSLDLLAMQSTRNPVKTAHYISRILNSKEECALYKRISPFATNNSSDETRITQSNFIQKVVKYISGPDRQFIRDRDALKKREPLVYADEKLKKQLIFRNMFIDEQDGKIALIINNYFNAVKTTWPNAWKSDKYVLCRTVGFNALMAYMRDALGVINKYDVIISEEEFSDVFKRLNINEQEWERVNFDLSGGGQSQVLKILRKEAKLS